MFLSGFNSPFYTDFGRLLLASTEMCVICYFLILRSVTVGLGLPNIYGEDYVIFKKVWQDSPGRFCLEERKNRMNKALENILSCL